jgi:hypothetical protein
MTAAPQLNLPDGSGTTTSLVITTNSLGLVFTGQVDQNIIDIQIDINGSGFTSDPTLVGLTLPTFTVPNLVSFPNGLTLDKGQNIISLRSIDLSGGVSQVSTITATIMADTEMQTVMAPPTGVAIQRRANSIELSWSDISPTIVTGYNVYASTGPGGSVSGYLRVNRDMIPANSPTTKVIDEFPTNSVDYDLADPNGDGNNIFISSQIQNPATNEVIQTTTNNMYSLLPSPKFRLSINITNLVETSVYIFSHNRADGLGNGILNSDTFSVVSLGDPLYYVVTAVYFDKTTGQMQESRYSQELLGSPLNLDTTVRGLLIRDQSTVVQDYISEIQKVQPELSLIPASTVREVHIEPFSNEIQKAYFLMDFVHRSKSFQALLQVDDPGLTGTSIPVANSAYKQNLKSALSVDSDATVQSVIDGAFDSLAQNFGVTREGLRQATVNQTFYTTVVPTRDLFVNQGAIVSSTKNPVAPRFIAKGGATLSAGSAQAFYNPKNKRYELTVQMIAEIPGSIGNVAAGDLETAISGANGLQTINDTSADFGRDGQSNLEVAEAASRALSSLDSGTEGGYYKTCIGTPGVLEVKIIKSGDEFMLRDYDSVRQKHIGGKVDIYVKGTIERTIIESFAFQFEMAKNVRFDLIDPLTLTFRARDSRLTLSNPIIEMLFNPSQGLGLRNHSITPTASYDLTGVTLIDYRTIRLNMMIPQPTTLLDDFIEGDYRFRSNNKFIPNLQPVLRISSVIGEISGALDPAAGFTLYKLQDPLLDGESTIAQDYVSINQVDDIPSGGASQVNDEQHILIGQFEELLDSVGINIFSLQVFSQDRTILYNGPSDANPDYLIIGGTQTSPISITRTTSSNIANGATVSVDYEHDENFNVTYVINDTLQQVQSRVNTQRHVTADVLIKQSLENPLSTEATVQLKPNASQSTVDSTIRTNMTILTDARGIGQPVHQSDMVAVIDDTDGVDFIVQPFSKFTLKDGSIRIRDQVLSDYDPLPSLDQFSNAVYILTQALPFNTIDGGGDSTIHHGIYKDTLIMQMATSLATIALAPEQAWIIGSQGAIIPGYSDDATLAPMFITPADIEAERIRLTANHVVVSLTTGVNPDIPSNHSFAATYVVNKDVGSKDIQVSQIEYLTPGELTLTYRSA